MARSCAELLPQTDSSRRCKVVAQERGSGTERYVLSVHSGRVRLVPVGWQNQMAGFSTPNFATNHSGLISLLQAEADAIRVCA